MTSGSGEEQTQESSQEQANGQEINVQNRPELSRHDESESQFAVPKSNIGGGLTDKERCYSSYLLKLQSFGKDLRSDRDQPSLSIKPTWFNEELFNHAKSVYERHFMGINFAHLSGLLLLVRVDTIYDTLSKTGESDRISKLFKRYYHTVKHVKTWYEGDIFEENSDAHRSLLIVRGMHNKTSYKLNDKARDKIYSTIQNNNTPEEPLEETKLMEKDNNGNTCYENASLSQNTNKIHISEYDIMMTQFAFVGFIVLHADKMGLIGDFSQKDMDSLLHFWRVIGYYLGAGEKLNLYSYEFNDVVGLCKAIREDVFRNSLIKNPLKTPQGIMSVNVIRAIKFIPMLTFYGMMKHLYDILEYDTHEIESRKTWYSNLSYTLINLVMTRLLRYKAFRLFNNGLTRLSLYLIGHIEEWFANHLESKYGQELRF